MPAETGYQSQVSPGATPELPMASPASFGAGIGQAIEGLGGELERRDQLQEQAQTLDASAKLSTTLGDLAKADPEDKAAAGPGGTGYSDLRLKRFDQATAPIIDGITDKRTKARMTAHLADERANLVAASSGWEAGQGAAKQATDTATFADAEANNNDTKIRADPLSFATVLGDSLIRKDATVEGLSLLTADERAKADHSLDGTIRYQALDSLAAVAPASAKEHLATGEYDLYLTKEQRARLEDKIDVEVRARDAAARSQLAAQKAQVQSTVELIKLRQGNGETVPQAELDKAQGDAAAVGDAAKVYELGAIGTRNGVNTTTMAYLPQDYDTRINQIAAKGDKASAREQVELDQLRKIAPQRKAQIAADPFGWAAANLRQPPPAIDLANPATLAARASYADGLGATLGMPVVPLLSAAEARPVAEAMAHGTTAQRIEAANEVTQWGPNAKRVLDQVAPNDGGGFRAAVALAALGDGGALMRAALSGPDALAARPNLLKPVKDAGGLPGLTHQQLFDADTRQATALLRPAYRAALLLNATNIYATNAGRAGFAELHPGEYQRSIRFALGGRETAGGWAGGLGAWNGQTIVLPRGMTQPMFDARLSRADGPKLSRASPAGAAWAGDRYVSAGELRSAVPVMVANGVYAFRQGNTYLLTKAGRRYTLDVGKLP